MRYYNETLTKDKVLFISYITEFIQTPPNTYKNINNFKKSNHNLLLYHSITVTLEAI